ncbi:unnamed protein product, partial [Aureobasidium mustum]
MTSSRRRSGEQPIVSPPHRISIGRGGAGNMKEIKEELKKASSNEEHDALAEHNRRRSSSSWSLHSSNNGDTSKTDAIKDFFRRGSRSKRKSVCQEDDIAEREEGEDKDLVEG